MHPLTENFAALSDEQISKKITEIRRILNKSQNYAVQAQAELILNTLMDLMQERAVAKFKEQPALDEKLASAIDVN